MSNEKLQNFSNLDEERIKRVVSDIELYTALHYVENAILSINNQLLYLEPSTPEIDSLKKELKQVLELEKQILRNISEKYIMNKKN